MILLDTHIWYWLVDTPSYLKPAQRVHLDANRATGLGVSIFTCWEIALLSVAGRLNLSIPLDDWIDTGLNFPGITLLPLTPAITIDGATLPGQFHRDPADRLLVATARTMNIPILTADRKILTYPHVTCLT